MSYSEPYFFFFWSKCLESSFALLAFMSVKHTFRHGIYDKNVQKGFNRFWFWPHVDFIIINYIPIIYHSVFSFSFDASTRMVHHQIFYQEEFYYCLINLLRMTNLFLDYYLLHKICFSLNNLKLNIVWFLTTFSSNQK